MAATMADIRYAFMKEFPKLTAGKSREEVKQIMKEMGYGIKSGLMKEFRKKKGLARGGVSIKKRIGTNDYRSGGMVLNSVDNRKSKS